jgi:hypothetical protein
MLRCLRLERCCWLWVRCESGCLVRVGGFICHNSNEDRHAVFLSKVGLCTMALCADAFCPRIHQRGLMWHHVQFGRCIVDSADGAA